MQSQIILLCRPTVTKIWADWKCGPTKIWADYKKRKYVRIGTEENKGLTKHLGWLKFRSTKLEPIRYSIEMNRSLPFIFIGKNKGNGCVLRSISGPYKSQDGCKTTSDITKTFCRGHCLSQSSFFRFPVRKDDSTCCRPKEYEKKTTNLECPDGSSKEFNYYIFKSCCCMSCYFN